MFEWEATFVLTKLTDTFKKSTAFHDLLEHVQLHDHLNGNKHFPSSENEYCTKGTTLTPIFVTGILKSTLDLIDIVKCQKRGINISQISYVWWKAQNIASRLRKRGDVKIEKTTNKKHIPSIRNNRTHLKTLMIMLSHWTRGEQILEHAESEYLNNFIEFVKE